MGKQLALGDEKAMSQVVGVVKDGKIHMLGEPPVAVVFRGSVVAGEDTGRADGGG